MGAFSTFILPGVLFILTLAFGFWLSTLGKPYNGILFNIHKLIALATVVVLTMQLFKTLQDTDPLVLVIVLLVVAAVCIIVLFASGALMSAGKMSYSLMLVVHRIAPGMLVIDMLLVFYLLAT